MNVPEGTPAIISCASCTTNCITPIVEVIGRRIGFEKAVMTTVHAYTSSQSIVDGPSKRFRRGRAAAANLVPAATGAAHATTRALPEYAGRFDGIAIRAPIPVGSIADITFVTSRKTTVDEVNQILTEEADTERYAGVLGVSRDPLVSSDIVGDPRASIVDLELTKVIDGDLVKVMSWYDNEWGYANQMLREAVSMSRGGKYTTLRSSASDRRLQCTEYTSDPAHRSEIDFRIVGPGNVTKEDCWPSEGGSGDPGTQATHIQEVHHDDELESGKIRRFDLVGTGGRAAAARSSRITRFQADLPDRPCLD